MKSSQRKKTKLGMLYSGFYSLRYNAQEFFGSKFGRENTPEKRLKDDVSEISDNTSFLGKPKNNATIPVSDNEANNEFDDTFERKLENTKSFHNRSPSDTRNKTDLSNFSRRTKNQYDTIDIDKTNATDIKDNRRQEISPFRKRKLDFAEEEESEDSVHLNNKHLRDSNKYFGRLQLLGKKDKIAKQGKLNKGLLLLQPGPKIQVGLYHPNKQKFFKNPFI